MNGKRYIFAFIILIILAAFFANRMEDIKPDKAELESYSVIRVVDGDTFVIEDNGIEKKVRLIGVDAPESVAPDDYLQESGKQNTEEGIIVSHFVKDLIENKTVYLEYDAAREDKYGRVLAYVYLEDGRMLQDILLEKGYAKIATYQPNVKYVDHFMDVVEKTR